MIPGVFTGQPSWLIILCVALAAGFALALYFREQAGEFPRYLKIILGMIRFAAVFLIAFLLLSPFTRNLIREKEKPVVIVAVDNSESILINQDSAYYKEDFGAELDRMISQLEEVAEVNVYHFGESLIPALNADGTDKKPGFREKASNLGAIFPELDNIYANRNVGAMIVATDGLFNAGSNPLYLSSNRPYPLYTIALGDTSIQKDQIITQVNYNRLVFLNNRFPFEIVVHAHELQGSRSRVRVFSGENELFSQEFIIQQNDFTQIFNAVFEARETGLKKYVVTVESLEGELSLTNNRKEVFVEVLDARNRVLILASAPHPDVSALKQAILSNRNYEADFFLFRDFTGQPEQYNLVILHQVPSLAEPAAALLSELEEKGIPALFIAGSTTDFARLNQAQDAVRILFSRAVLDEAVPVYNKSFTSFSLDASTVSWLSDLPPLTVPLGEYQASNASKTLIYQRLGNLETSRPMVTFYDSPQGRKGLITGEGIWKWRLFDYARNQDHSRFNELVNKMVQYLSLREQKKNFRVYHASSFRENEDVIFSAEIYDESFELTTMPEIRLRITNDEGNQFPYAFNKSGNSYRLNAGRFPPGNYTWEAVTEGGESYQATGSFSVALVDLEALNTVADHRLLRQMADENKGRMVFPVEMNALAAEISGRDDIRPVTYTRKKFTELLGEWWLLALITTLLASEWFLRKRAGSY